MLTTLQSKQGGTTAMARRKCEFMRSLPCQIVGVVETHVDKPDAPKTMDWFCGLGWRTLASAAQESDKSD